MKREHPAIPPRNPGDGDWLWMGWLTAGWGDEPNDAIRRRIDVVINLPHLIVIQIGGDLPRCWIHKDLL